ncbi:hypothetical protein [Streptomyces sp. NBC_00046]
MTLFEFFNTTCRQLCQELAEQGRKNLENPLVIDMVVQRNPSP